MAVYMTDKNSIKAIASEKQKFNIASVGLRDSYSDFTLSRVPICAKTTLKNYAVVLGRFISWLEEQGVQEPSDLSARFIRQYLALFVDKSSWYQNDIARQIRTFVRFLFEEGYITSPIKFELPKVKQKRLPFCTAEQIEKLLSVCDVREKAIIALMVDSGLRKQEVVNLNLGDVDLQTGLVLVRQGKGKKDRVSAVGATTRRVLLKYIRTLPNQNENAPLFQTINGGRFTSAGLRSLFTRLSKKAGFRVTPHMLRRTTATQLLKNGMDLATLQSLLGHSSVEVTRHYIQLLDNDLLIEHAKSSPIDNLKQSGRKR